LRLAWRRRIVGECVKCSGLPVTVEPLAALVVCSRFVGCVDRLRKLAARCFACLQLIGVMCGNACSSRLQVDSLTVCTFASVTLPGVGCKCWRMVCALVAILPRVNRASVAALVVCVQDKKQDNKQGGKRERLARTGGE